MASQKAFALAHDIAAKLRLRTTLTITESVGTSGDPLVRVGAASTTNPGALIRFIPEPRPLAKDSLENTALQYSPTVAQTAWEANYAATTDNVADVNTFAAILPILGVLIGAGVCVEAYVRANGTAPAETDITAGNLVARFDSTAEHGWLANV